MCLRPRYIRNRAKNIGKNGGKLFVCIPCGECSECRKEKADGYLARANAEYEHTKSVGGFTYFDTFTYDEDNVPSFGSIKCFNTSHYKDFFKRLRRDLEYHGYDVKGHLKYFWVSEYGGKTHRPHYHCLFFVTIEGMTPMRFRYYLKRNWKFGFIDRFYTVHKRVVDGQGALNYVAKYVNKDDDFTKNLKSMRDHYFTKWSEAKREGSNMVETYWSLYEFYADKKTDGNRTLFPFHRQSQGFGITLLDQLDSIYETGMVTIPDKKNIRKRVQCPMYIIRKLFYETVKDEFCGTNEEGKIIPRWKITDYGKEWKENRLMKSIDLMVKRYQGIVDNISNYELKKGERIYTDDEKLFFINHLLDGRSLLEYCVYKLVYQYKLYSKRYYLRKCGYVNSELPDMYDFYYSSLDDISEISVKYRVANIDDDDMSQNPNDYRVNISYAVHELRGFYMMKGLWHLARYVINQDTFDEFRYITVR